MYMHLFNIHEINNSKVNKNVLPLMLATKISSQMEIYLLQTQDQLCKEIIFNEKCK